jgi:hypothetical protein
MLIISFLTFLANCAGSGSKEMKDLLSKDEVEEGIEDNLLSEENLGEDAFAENQNDDVMAADDTLEEEAEDNFNFDNNTEEKLEGDDSLLSLENPSDLNDVEIKKLDDVPPSEEVAPLDLETKEDVNGRVVRYVKVDCNVYDASKSKVVGSFKKGEPVVVAIGSDGWGMLSEAHFIKVENLSAKGVGRVRR